MYCNQCGCEIKDTARFCKKCGAPVEDDIKETSESKSNAVRFLYNNRIKLMIAVLIMIVLCAGVIAGFAVWKDTQEAKQAEEEAKIKLKVSSCDLLDEYEIEDNKLILDPVHVTYSDGTVKQLTGYKVYIDTYEYVFTDGYIDAKDLYDGTHLIRLEWIENGKDYKYEHSAVIAHKKDTWEKYPDIVGLTGKEISKAYGKLGSPQFGNFQEGDWGYAYVQLPAYNMRLTFPAGIFENPSDYGDSDAQCLEMSATLNDVFYNMEPEMTMEQLAEILELNLSQSGSGGCTATLGSGKLMYIGEGQVYDGVYRPDTSVRVTVSEKEKVSILDYFF